MHVMDSRHDHCAAEIAHLCAFACVGRCSFVGPHKYDPVTLDGDGLCDTAGCVNGIDVAVGQHEVCGFRDRRLLASREQQQNRNEGKI
jgi:hypothetical protein